MFNQYNNNKVEKKTGDSIFYYKCYINGYKQFVMINVGG